MSEVDSQALPATAAPRRAVRTPGQAPAAPTVAAVASEPDGLPNAIDLDARTLKTPVLTRQGWVCPDETGRPVHGPR